MAIRRSVLRACRVGKYEVIAKFSFNTPDLRNYQLDLARSFEGNNFVFELHADEVMSAEILLDKNKSADIYVPNCKKIITTLNLNYEKNIDKLIINTYEIIKRNEY